MKKIAALLCALTILFTNNYVANAESLQEELARIEAKSSELEDKINSSESYMAMSDYSMELHDLWENEINSLWSRLSNKLDPKTKKRILAQQRIWIKRKDKYSQSVGELALGGRLQSHFEYRHAISMTQARSYILAKYLAEVTNEKFTVPEDLNKTIHSLEPFLDDVFKLFEGQWKAEDNIKMIEGLRLIVERSDSCFYEVEGSKWTVWVSDGLLLSDKNLYDYTGEYIIFKVSKNGKNIFYKLMQNYDESIDLTGWDSLEKLKNSTEQHWEEGNDPIYSIWASENL